MFKNYLRSWVASHQRALKEQKGQSIIIITFAFIGLIGMLGLALDLGLVYIERVKIGRTTDAAALAGVVELPYEEESIRRAIEYIQLNGYNVGVDTQVLVRGCIDTDLTSGQNFKNVDRNGILNPTAVVPVTYTTAITGYPYPPSVVNPKAVFVIDTLAYQPVIRTGGVVTTKNQENCNSTGKLYGKANKLRVSGEVKVNMNFMQFFGFRTVPVSDEAVGENVTSLDIAIVFDVSGSMDYETNCFGCWREYPEGDPSGKHDPVDNPFPLNGAFYPSYYDVPSTIATETLYLPSSVLCTAPVSPTVRDTYSYLVHEAEYYSRNDANEIKQGWAFDRHTPGQGYWVLQRAGVGSNFAHIRAHPYVTYSQRQVEDFPQLQGMSYDQDCFDPDFGQCWRNKGLSIGETSPAISKTVPFVEYDFTTSWPSSQPTSIWIRAQGGSFYASEWDGQSPSSLTPYTSTIWYKVDNESGIRGGRLDRLVSGLRDLTWTDGTGNIQFSMNEANWYWVKVGSQGLAAGPHTLRLYQGSTGFNVDKIIITNNPWGGTGDVFRPTPSPGGSNSNSLGLPTNAASGFTSLQGTLILNGHRGPDATRGSATREACNVCNPIFGGTSPTNPVVTPAQCSCKKSSADTAVANPAVYPAGGSGDFCIALAGPTNMLENDLYHDVDPMRSAQEAVKNFASRLDPRFDQLGLVPFTGPGVGQPTSMRAPRVKLHCLLYAQTNLTGGNACFDETNGITYTNVIRAMENHSPDFTTDIPTGMREGLEELGLDINNSTTIQPGVCSTDSSKDGDGKSCDRQGTAKRILILMTDGSPNVDHNCSSAGLWRGQFGKGNSSYDCSMYYAREAANNFVTVYTIGIGAGVNTSLLKAMAEGTDPNPDPADATNGFYFESRGGKYYPAAKPSELDTIFEDILDNIFVRIVG